MADKDQTIRDLESALLQTLGELEIYDLDKMPGVPEMIKRIKSALIKSGYKDRRFPSGKTGQ